MWIIVLAIVVGWKLFCATPTSGAQIRSLVVDGLRSMAYMNGPLAAVLPVIGRR